MDVLEIAPGLWRWTAWHEEWKQAVGCVYRQSSDAVVLIDPLVPPENPDRFWRALDRDVEQAGVPVHVLVTVFWHARSAGEVVRRYAGRLWAPSRARAAIERRTHAVTDVFRPGDPLPGGVRAFATAHVNDVVYWLPEHGALVPGDVILGDEDGGLRMCPESWLPKGTGHAKLRDSLRPLLDLPVERVLVSHGEPVLAGGHHALASALQR
jgi:glyoxylase-like metal-dependent hydrolase (beta-lactamase superfamily II)